MRWCAWITFSSNDFQQVVGTATCVCWTTHWCWTCPECKNSPSIRRTWLSLHSLVCVTTKVENSPEQGVKLGLLDSETQKHGVVVPAGHNPDTGIAGLTLGGGVGFLVKKFGLTVDNLLSVRIVLANGELVEANDKENPDLFWAIRGKASKECFNSSNRWWW